MDIKQEENKLKKHRIAFKQKLIGAGHSSHIHHVLTPSSMWIQPRREMGGSGKACPAQEILSAQQDPLPNLTAVFTGIESYI